MCIALLQPRVRYTARKKKKKDYPTPCEFLYIVLSAKRAQACVPVMLYSPDAEGKRYLRSL